MNINMFVNNIFKFSSKNKQFIRKNSYYLQYMQHGEPAKVISKEKYNVPKDLEENQIHVKMMAAPVNPADINMIQGTYAIKPNLPAIGGNEGVGKIVKLGSGVKNLKLGSWVIPSSAGSGTWRSDWVCSEQDVIEIPKDVPLETASTISVNPCTAYRMIHDFVNLKRGDTIIQNGANSGVGQMVIQIAKYFEFQTINVVRNRPNLEELVDRLKGLGANHVITEEDLRLPKWKSIYSEIPKPKLALNCVGGKSSTELFRHISPGGVMVTYGGMSKQPVIVPTGSLIFHDIKIAGFWMTRWSQQNSNSPARKKMLDTLFKMANEKHLMPPKCQTISLDNFEEALKKAMEPFIDTKMIFVLDK